MYSAIAGGNGNRIQTYVLNSTIGGGEGNTIQSKCIYATVPGGKSNSAAGYFSFAAGYRAKAMHDGTFVWADDTDADHASTGDNQFLHPCERRRATIPWNQPLLRQPDPSDVEPL